MRCGSRSFATLGNLIDSDSNEEIRQPTIAAENETVALLSINFDEPTELT
jgi:hypothetical protein